VKARAISTKSLGIMMMVMDVLLGPDLGDHLHPPKSSRTQRL
jgi:hypothetical protein